MAMELLACDHFDIFYPDPSDANRAKRFQLEGNIRVLAWVATIDAFQHWIYTHPGHSVAQRTRAWLDTRARFMGDVDFSGLEAEHEAFWQRQLHIFQIPFYYIEYGIAQLGSLQLWMRSRQDRESALANYRHALRLGGTKPLPELFSAAGLVFDFSEKTVAPLVSAVAQELDSLPA
jgi:oligoendopeptidase F